jgi:hypothetical protein
MATAPSRLVLFLVFLVDLILCQAATSQVHKTVPQPSLTAAVGPTRASLELEWDRAIVVLKRGLKEHWATRGQYLTAFEKTPGTDPTGQPVTKAKSYVECEIGEHLPTHEVWDEKWDHGQPINVEVQRTIDEFIARRKGQFHGPLSSSCAAPVPKK